MLRSLQCPHTLQVCSEQLWKGGAHSATARGSCYHHPSVIDEKWRLREGLKAAGDGRAVVGTVRRRQSFPCPSFR